MLSSAKMSIVQTGTHCFETLKQGTHKISYMLYIIFCSCFDVLNFGKWTNARIYIRLIEFLYNAVFFLFIVIKIMNAMGILTHCTILGVNGVNIILKRKKVIRVRFQTVQKLLWFPILQFLLEIQCFAMSTGWEHRVKCPYKSP